MKKVIIVINNLEIGGVQSSLVNLLHEICDKYDITVLTFHYIKEYEDILPEKVKLITVMSPYKHLGMSKKDTDGKPFLYASRAMWVTMTKFFGRSFALKLMNVFQKKIIGYDLAISYLHEGPQKNLYGGCNEFVLNKIDAKEKFTWVHCDFTLCGANNKQSAQLYKKFDKIIACSEGAREAFLKCMPELKDKCIAVRNCNNFDNIRKLAENAKKYGDDCFNIVTVARLSAEKGISRAINAVKSCIDKGYKIKYHIVGGGIEETSLKNMVSALKLDDCVEFYGNQRNPYPYMVDADLFLLPSYHEAAPMVFDEAACLGVPILATKTTSTDEMILETGFGFVCDNSQDGIYSKLLYVLNNKSELLSIKNNLTLKEFSNRIIIDKLENILN